MSRLWSVAILVLAGFAMWLAVGWPSADKAEPHEGNDAAAVAEATAPKAVALPQAPKADAAAPEPEEPLEEPAQPATPEVPQGPAPWPQGDILAGNRGPVDEYQALYNRQARDSAATDAESAIGAGFKHSTRPDLLHSASCHESVCKVLIRWSPDRAKDYIQSMRWLALGTSWPPGQPGFEDRVAITAASENDKNGARLVEVYLKRRPPSAAKPAAHPH